MGESRGQEIRGRGHANLGQVLFFIVWVAGVDAIVAELSGEPLGRLSAVDPVRHNHASGLFELFVRDLLAGHCEHRLHQRLHSLFETVWGHAGPHHEEPQVFWGVGVGVDIAHQHALLFEPRVKT